MSKNNRSAHHKRLTGLVYSLLAILTMLFSIIIVISELAQSKTQRLNELANQYHLYIAEKNLELLSAIDQTRLWFRSDFFERNQTNSTNLPRRLTNSVMQKDQISGLIHQIQVYNQSTTAIEQKYLLSEFATLNANRSQAQTLALEGLAKLRSANDFNIEQIDTIVKPLIAVTHQALRMHQIANQNLRSTSEQETQSNRRKFIIMVFVLAAIGTFGVIRLLRHVQLTLTELNTIEHQLRQSEKRLKDAEHLSRTGYIDWDPISGETSWSHEIYLLHGFSDGTTPSIEALLEIVDSADRQPIEQVFKNRQVNPGNHNFEYRIRHQDDSVTYFNAKALTELDSTQQIKRVLLTVVDVTEQKLVELELQGYRDQLEKLVEERTKKLIDAQQELLRNERLATLGQLTATVSHELRNPLGAMRPSLYILDKNSDKSNAQVSDALKRMDRNIDRCDSIIDELLDYTRIKTLDCQATPIDQWLDNVLQDQNITKTICVETSYSLNRITLNLDDNRLRRAVINVLQNACEAMTGTKAKDQERLHWLKVSTQISSKRFEIVIADNGRGIAQNVIDKVFEPLFSTKSFGVGLGMPTVKQIMEQHDGGVEISSKLNTGTTIILWLPAKSQVSGMSKNKGAAA